MDGTWTAIIDRRIWAAVIPFITVGTGLLVLHNAWLALLLYHLGILAVLVSTGRKILFKRALANRSKKILLITATLGLASGLLFYLLWPFLHIPSDINLYLQHIGFTEGAWPYFIIYYILINPWLEEFYWRGYLGSDSRRIQLNDMLFSGYHTIVLAGKIDIPWLIVAFAMLSLGAWFWRQANRWNRGLAASIVSHIAADIAVILTIYFMAT